MGWQDDACVIISTRGTREEILAGGGEERVFLRFPERCPKLTEAELELADRVMAEWDRQQAAKAAKEAA